MDIEWVWKHPPSKDLWICSMGLSWIAQCYTNISNSLALIDESIGLWSLMTHCIWMIPSSTYLQQQRECYTEKCELIQGKVNKVVRAQHKIAMSQKN